MQKIASEYRSKTPAELVRLIADVNEKILDLALEIRRGKTKNVRALRAAKKERARVYTVLRALKK